MRKNEILIVVFLAVNFSFCNERNENSERKIDFCDCVNHDYHKEGDKETCDSIEVALKDQLERATKEEKGEILMRINDCKIKGQYDND